MTLATAPWHITADATHVLVTVRDPMTGEPKSMRFASENPYPLAFSIVGYYEAYPYTPAIHLALPALTVGQQEFLLTGLREDEWGDLMRMTAFNQQCIADDEVMDAEMESEQ